ncbi:MAG: arginine--tRNA ligase [Bernardetiaceae bacterium]
MSIADLLTPPLITAFARLFGGQLSPHQITWQPTRKDFEGHYTFVTFPLTKQAGKAPQAIAEALGAALQADCPMVSRYNVVKGFLNIVLEDAFWIQHLSSIQATPDYGQHPHNGQRVMIEYSSPNTNKPLHLGHLRNNFLGFALAQIMEKAGYAVRKVNLVNDRGIHICKSMLMYQKYGEGITPEAAQKKGDQLIGDFYVRFDAENKAQAAQIGCDPNQTPLMEEARALLRAWEDKDPEVYALWQRLNAWVLEGHQQTYTDIGVSFEATYLESDTYLLGKEIVQEGIEKGVFYRREDGSVWCDLTHDGLDEKLVLRADGTSVYITQDMGTADLKYADFAMQKSIYVVGNEQDYHFQVLQKLMQKLGRPYAEGIYHLSYGMVELPSGKMKTREGTVVDADQLLEQMIEMARGRTQELGKIEDFAPDQVQELYQQLALGALKYYLLRVEPRKKMLFNPEESIDFQGNSGVYLQYTHAKARAIVRKAEAQGIAYTSEAYAGHPPLTTTEQDLIRCLGDFPVWVQEAATTYAPSLIAQYAYDLARAYSRLWADLPIFGAAPEATALRVALSEQSARVLRLATALLGMQMPERM